MAFVHGKNTSLTFGTVTLTPYLNNVDFPRDAATADTTVFGIFNRYATQSDWQCAPRQEQAIFMTLVWIENWFGFMFLRTFLDDVD